MRIGDRSHSRPRGVVARHRRHFPALIGDRGAPGAGFTLVELMIVVSIMLLLIAMAAPIYRTSIIRAKEAVLRDNLFTMRQLIDEYTLDKQKAPQSLEDLATAGYLRVIPRDPFTGNNTSWEVVMEDTMMAVDQTEPGIVDVRSGSSLISLEETPYNTW